VLEPKIELLYQKLSPPNEQDMPGEPELRFCQLDDHIRNLSHRTHSSPVRYCLNRLLHYQRIIIWLDS